MLSYDLRAGGSCGLRMWPGAVCPFTVRTPGCVCTHVPVRPRKRRARLMPCIRRRRYLVEGTDPCNSQCAVSYALNSTFPVWVRARYASSYGACPRAKPRTRPLVTTVSSPLLRLLAQAFTTSSYTPMSGTSITTHRCPQARNPDCRLGPCPLPRPHHHGAPRGGRPPRHCRQRPQQCQRQQRRPRRRRRHGGSRRGPWRRCRRRWGWWRLLRPAARGAAADGGPHEHYDAPGEDTLERSPPLCQPRVGAACCSLCPPFLTLNTVFHPFP